MRPRLALPFVLLLAAAGCAMAPGTPGNGGTSPDAGATPDLLASLQATTGEDGVRFVLQVTNTTEAPRTLAFRSGQRFDFVVERDGREVWRWSSDQMFTQAVGRETLAAGETLTYSATWRPEAGLQGDFTAAGVLTATPGRVEQRARFRLP